MNKKKVLATITACGLVAAMALGGTLAYLTDNESHTNSVTVSGNIRIDLVEENWDETDTNKNGVPDASEETVPNQEINKDPKVLNTGENPAIAFLRVTVPVKDVTRVLDNGTLVSKDGTAPASGPIHEAQDIFYFKDGLVDGDDQDDETDDPIATHANHFNANWIRLENSSSDTFKYEYNPEVTGGAFVDQTVGQAVYLFGYKTAVAPGEDTDTLFDKIQVKNIIENEIASDQVQNIKLEAFAIQADNILDANGNKINYADNLDATELKEIYRIYVNQNLTVDSKGDVTWTKWQDAEHGQVEKEAETNNERNLNNTAAHNATTFENNSVKLSSGNADMKVGDTSTLSYALSSQRNGATTAELAPKYFIDGVPAASYTGGVVSVTAGSGQTATIRALKQGDATVTVECDGTRASVQIAVINDTHATNGNDAENDASNIPNGTTEKP